MHVRSTCAVRLHNDVMTYLEAGAMVATRVEIGQCEPSVMTWDHGITVSLLVILVRLALLLLLLTTTSYQLLAYPPTSDSWLERIHTVHWTQALMQQVSRRDHI